MRAHCAMGTTNPSRRSPIRSRYPSRKADQPAETADAAAWAANLRSRLLPGAEAIRQQQRSSLCQHLSGRWPLGCSGAVRWTSRTVSQSTGRSASRCSRRSDLHRIRSRGIRRLDLEQ